MARITTVWDNVNGTNTKVFMVRGEEAYARTTDIQLSLKSTVSGATNGFVATAVVDVLRDTGNSTITFYDGDDVLSVADWSYTDHNKEIALPRLSWDVEHLIWARYNGNTSCLKSKSNTISITKANPDLTDTTITNTTSTINYTSSESITVTATLNKASGNASLQGREIEFYVDGVLKGTANTSNSSGNVSKSIGTLSNGLHEIGIVFQGDNPLGASETKFTISVGYLMELIEYPKTFLNGTNNTVKISMKNYMGDPVSGKSISFGGKSATTGSDGIATISNITSVTDGSTMYASYSTYTSNNITARACTPTGISIVADDGITVNGSVEPIIITLSGTGTLGDVPISIGGAITGTYTTSSNGQILLNYMGDGGGNKVITATVNVSSLDPTVASDSVLVQDLLYYVKAREFNNASPILTRVKHEEQSSFIITPTVVESYGAVDYPISASHWEATFTLVNFADKNRWGIDIQGVTLDADFKVGDEITVINDSNGTTLKRNGVIKSTHQNTNSKLMFTVNNGTNYLKCRMFYDNLKIWRID